RPASPSRARPRDARGRPRSQELPLREEVDDLPRRVAVVLDLARLATRRRVADRQDAGARARLAERARVETEVGAGKRLLRLLLRAHDPLQRRVARLVDRIRD